MLRKSSSGEPRSPACTLSASPPATPGSPGPSLSLHWSTDSPEQRTFSIREALRVAAHAIADIVGSLLGREPVYIPVTTDPGKVGLIATPDAQPGREMILKTLPDDVNWPNRITARSLFNIIRSRPARHAADIQCPLLMIVAQHDTMAPTRAAAKVGARAPRGRLFRSQGEHYDIYQGGIAYDEILELERRFIRRELDRDGANATSAPMG